MHVTLGVHPIQPPRTRSRPLLRTPLFHLSLRLDPPLISRCHREHRCSSPCFFPPSPLKNPRYLCNFRCNVYLAEWGLRGEGWRASCIEKEPHSQTVWAALEGKHVQEGCTRRVVKELRLVCSGPDTQIPPQQGHRAALCSFPNRLSLINIPLPPLVCSIDSAPCWIVEDMTQKKHSTDSPEISMPTNAVRIDKAKQWTMLSNLVNNHYFSRSEPLVLFVFYLHSTPFITPHMFSSKSPTRDKFVVCLFEGQITKGFNPLIWASLFNC